jgi:hypothetical protein
VTVVNNGVMQRSRRRAAPLVVLLAVALTATACSGSSSDRGTSTTTTAPSSSGGPTTTTPDAGDPQEPEVTDAVRIEVLSSQPDRVTGDDARIRITPSSGSATGSLRVDLDGTDVTGSLAPVDGALEGVVHGLVEGTNSLTVRGDGAPATLRLRSWPRQGPMISGPQTPLLVCTTVANGLGEPSDAATCAAPTKVSFRYLTTAGALAPLPDPKVHPADQAEITVGGRRVPAIIRVERGVVNRSVYETATPVATASTDPAATVDAVWNRRLVLAFGDGCGATYGQGELPAADATDAALLAAGYGIATATFTQAGVQCNDVVATETALMVKERFIESVGAPEATIGEGRGTGGALVHLASQNYPDLLGGGVTVDAYSDLITLGNEFADCTLLDRFFAAGGSSFTPAQRQAITGYSSPTTCATVTARFGTPFVPTTGCDPQIPTDKIWAKDRPDGVRCTMQDISAVPFGRDADGAAFRPVDNEGLQYGLDALEAGTISMDQFLALNRAIGGLDPNGTPVAARTVAPESLLQTVYENGRVSAGTGDQTRVPFVDIVGNDPATTGEPGDLHRAIAFRLRLTRIAGRAVGQQIWLVADPAKEVVDGVTQVDAWLTAKLGKGSGRDVLAQTMPDGAASRCERAGAATRTGGDLFDVEDEGCLDGATTLGADPRIAAGAHATDDVIKCQLRPVDPTEYPGRIDADTLDQLLEIFPNGVCDWTVAGTGQSLPSMSDRSFDDVETPADRA